MTNGLPTYELVFTDNAENVFGCSLVFDPANAEEFIKFSKQEDDDIPDDVVKSLIERGETVDSEEWELIDEVPVTDESVLNIDLSITPSEGDSEQDNEIFRIRYEYAPADVSENSRAFCIEMANAGLVYKKEDLVDSDANPGFGPNGASSYNIFKYKGGVNCKHYWKRNIYLKRKNNKEVTVFEALKYIGSLDKASQRLAKLPQNPKEVSQVASEDNNYWKLSRELEDIKMTSEEKKILTCPVLLPDQLIYRNFNGEKCNVFLTRETIELCQQNFFKNGYQKNSTIEHKEIIDGVYFFESWIVMDAEKDKAKALGYNVPAGTWMMSMKVENQKVWDEYVKTGKVTGFSIDARLGVNRNTKNKDVQKMNYSKVKEQVMKEILMNANLSEIVIDNNLTVYVEALEQDMVVFDKDNQPMPNAEFTYESKLYKTGENGEIISIEDVQSKEVDAADETAPDTAKMQEDLEVANGKVAELEAENQSLKAEIEILKEELNKVKEEAIELAKQPSSEGVNLKNISTVDYDKLNPYQKYKLKKTS